MIYKGIPCEKCKIEFSDTDDVVVCPVCGSPYHRACWEKDNTCAHVYEHGEGYQWIKPVTEEPEQPKKAYLPNEFILKNGESVIICPNCSTMNCENDVYCVRCKALLRQQNNTGFNSSTSDTQYTSDDQYQGMRNRMYEDFNRFGAIAPDSELDGIPVRELSDYIGGNAPGKIIRKFAIMERFGKKISACFPALILGPIWFFWRKMIKEGVLLSIVLIALNLLSGLLTINPQYEKYVKASYDLVTEYSTGTMSNDEFIERNNSLATTFAEEDFSPEDALKMNIASVLYSLSFSGIAIFSSVMSMHFYRKKCKKSILSIREMCSSMDEYRNTLIKEGGTSVGWAVIGVLSVALAYFCVNVLPLIIVMTK